MRIIRIQAQKNARDERAHVVLAETDDAIIAVKPFDDRLTVELQWHSEHSLGANGLLMFDGVLTFDATLSDALGLLLSVHDVAPLS
jgi:hypothetical protein